MTSTTGSSPEPESANVGPGDPRDFVVVPMDEPLPEPEPGSANEEGPFEQSLELPIQPPVGDDLPDPVTRGRGWERLPDGRWVLGEAGKVAAVLPRPSVPSVRPDTAVDGANVGTIAFRAASLRGLSHQIYAKPRQDAYEFQITKGEGWLIGCVADGVSQGRWSHAAADLACHHLIRVIASALDGSEAPTTSDGWTEISRALPWQVATDDATAAIVDAAVVRLRSALPSTDGRDQIDELLLAPDRDAQIAKLMSTTAIVFAVGTRPTDDRAIPFALAVAAGDSSAFILSGSEWLPITAVKNEGQEIASSAVRPLPSRGVLVESKSGLLRPGEALVVMTDGVGDPLGAGKGVVGQFLSSQWNRPPELLAFAGHVGFVRKTFVDDRTVFAVWNVAE